jgi:hypothetical protein
MRRRVYILKIKCTFFHQRIEDLDQLYFEFFDEIVQIFQLNFLCPPIKFHIQWFKNFLNND